MRRSELGTALVLAIVGHVAVLAGASLFPKQRGAVAGSAALDEALFEVVETGAATRNENPPPKTEPEPAAPKDPPEGKAEANAKASEPPARIARPSETPAASRALPSDAARAPSSAPEPRAEARAPSGETTPKGPNDAKPSDSEYSRTPAGPAPGLPPGLGGTPLWARPGGLPAAPDARPAPAPTTVKAAPKPVDDSGAQAIRSTLDTKDHALGLDQPAAGAVASTIEDTIRSSDLPSDAKATFEVKLGADGKVLGVRTLGVTAGESAQWERVAKRAASALAKKQLALRGDAASRGATVTVKIESKAVFPAGSKKKIDAQPVCAEEVLADLANQVGSTLTNGEAMRPIQDGRIDTTQMLDAEGQERRRKFCIPVGIAGKTDLSNMAAHMQTRVSSTYKVSVPGVLPMPARVLPIDTRVPWAPVDPNREAMPKKPKPKPKKK